MDNWLDGSIGGDGGKYLEPGFHKLVVKDITTKDVKGSDVVVIALQTPNGQKSVNDEFFVNGGTYTKTSKESKLGVRLKEYFIGLGVGIPSEMGDITMIDGDFFGTATKYPNTQELVAILKKYLIGKSAIFNLIDKEYFKDGIKRKTIVSEWKGFLGKSSTDDDGKVSFINYTTERNYTEAERLRTVKKLQNAPVSNAPVLAEKVEEDKSISDDLPF